jgi:hypothetical protein
MSLTPLTRESFRTADRRSFYRGGFYRSTAD